VQASIGDGCYRSLQQFAKNQYVHETLEAKGKVVDCIKPADRSKQPTANSCPYFQIGQKSFACPFTQTEQSDVNAIYEVCKGDPAHP
jgi:hypothetical protein